METDAYAFGCLYYAVSLSIDLSAFVIKLAGILQFYSLWRGTSSSHRLARHNRTTSTAIRIPENGRLYLESHQRLLEIPSFWTSAIVSNHGNDKVVHYASSRVLFPEALGISAFDSGPSSGDPLPVVAHKPITHHSHFIVARNLPFITGNPRTITCSRVSATWNVPIVTWNRNRGTARTSEI
jgi:hypothetical protein